MQELLSGHKQPLKGQEGKPPDVPLRDDLIGGHQHELVQEEYLFSLHRGRGLLLKALATLVW